MMCTTLTKTSSMRWNASQGIKVILIQTLFPRSREHVKVWRSNRPSLPSGTNQNQLRNQFKSIIVNKFSELLDGLMKDQLIKEYGLMNPDECVGIKDGEIYIHITHEHIAYNDARFIELCDSASIVSEDCSDGEYETQLIIELSNHNTK